ncbi:NAD(P)/FAD-dependent oxidoreductase [Altericroceibacterium spongiae]|uniref:NAD(P)/FAD-dependent oxidoreductase n=1 Tax=Altericroceibacterium spongiae TaxID=2320269 RepID=A0A420EM18_9SPHN|nr:NAD(P)/FAD-dependent oxidoreductase [Altericroceibacterium spongiae]RKF21728.1 NAD(P)/FAD-dependent oxidoreductase [Altericroceibacterium spongiae]
MKKSYDAIILGAGAAGLFCAAEAGLRGRRILLIDHAEKPGKKILISGGGRCNFTNLGVSPECYLSANRHFMKSALSRYTAQDFIALVDHYGIPWHEKTLGQLFCDGSSRQIVDLLLGRCKQGQVALQCGKAVRSVTHADGFYRVTTDDFEAEAPALVVATGGPAIPKMGATGFAYELARQFNLKVVQPRPALVPLTLSREDALFRELSGVASEVIASYGKTAFREAALFTHRGLSGPAILQISSYWQSGHPVRINFCPTENTEWLVKAKSNSPKNTLCQFLRRHLPDRLADVLNERLALDGILAELPDKALRRAGAQLANWEFYPDGTEGYAKAEVTAGGVSTAELSSQTMEAKRVSGLYFIGEAVDVTGWLGGYNFQWAWSSGWAAAQIL